MRHSFLITALTFVTALSAVAEWPMYRANVRRSGVTTESLRFPLSSAWEHNAPAPEQAWTGPAKWDAYSGNSGLQSMRNFDPCYYVTGRNNLVFYGSSADNGIHCMDASNGKEKWVFFTDSAVRQPPTLYQDLAIAGSDDGYVYAINIKDGTLAWKLLAAVKDHRIPSNGKLISLWPVRTGVTVLGDKAYFAASLTPWESTVLWCVDPSTGKVGAAGTWRKELKGVTLQGACLAGQGKLFVPQGRSAPLVYNLTDGKPLGNVGKAGGVFCLLDESGRLIAGPQNQRSKDDQIRVLDPATNQHLITFGGATRVVIAGDFACVQNGQKLRCFNYRKFNEIKAQQVGLNAKLKPLQKQLAELKKQAAEEKTEEKEAAV
ncbi:MAG: PQQ-binding-like beta-propeller repeat protein, partial [Akkermansiaceae bacterium]